MRCEAGPTRGFTLAELLVTIAVIFLIMGIAVVAYSAATRSAQSAADRAAVNGLRLAVDRFDSEFGFLPPLVKDDGGLDGQFPLVLFKRNDADPGRVIPVIASAGDDDDLRLLRGENPDRARFSLLSLPYYIIGSLDSPVDGVDGPGFVEVRRDGTFAPVYQAVDADGERFDSSGRGPTRYDPFFDLGRGGLELWADPRRRFRLIGGGSGNQLSRQAFQTQFELRDRRGVAVRYYRWLPDGVDFETQVALSPDAYTDTDTGYGFENDSLMVTGLLAYFNVPGIVVDGIDPVVVDRDGDGSFGPGDLAEAVYQFPFELRSATYAIVAAGPNQLFGDETVDQIKSDEALRRRYTELLNLSERRLRNDDEYIREAIRAARADNIVEVGS